MCFRIQPFVPAWFLFELFNCLNCGALLVKTAFTEWNLPCFCLNSKFTGICSAFRAYIWVLNKLKSNILQKKPDPDKSSQPHHLQLSALIKILQVSLHNYR